MNKKYYLIISIIFFLSFRFYSSLFYPLLNSDNAVTILMIHYFKLPDDLYFWGQDRMGSLIPLLGQIPFKLLGFSALASEALVHYTILLVGFFSFAFFLKSSILKLIFAIVWFLPPLRLIDGIQLYTGVEYSIIAFSYYLINYYRKTNRNNSLFRHLILLSISFLLIAAIWVSDLALITVFVLLALEVYYEFKLKKISFSWFQKIELKYFFIGILLGYSFIHYAKNNSAVTHNYSAISDFNSIWKTIIIFYNSLLDLFMFRAGEPFTSVYSYLVIFIFINIIFLYKHIELNDNLKKILLFFLFDAVIVFLLIILSKWTILNDVPRRYFTCTYISLSFAVLLLIDNLKINIKYTYSILLITAIIGGIGSVYNIKYIWPKTLVSRVDIAREFQKLGEIGIISDYWNSYINSCPNPDVIKSTPYEFSGSVRNYALVDEVFKQRKIYVIKDMWLEHFPDSLRQFGRLLIRDGKEFYLGDSYVCKYKLITQ